MSWARLDDSFDTHAKILQLGELQRWRWTRVLLHCARHRTDGKVDAAVLKEYGLARTTATLIKVGLLDVDDGGGYVVHDWAEFNPKDSTKAARQARWRAKQPPEASTHPSTSPSTGPSTQPSTVAATVDTDVDTETVSSRVGARARPVPYPKDQDPSFLPAVAKDPAPEEKAGRRNLLDEDRIHPFDLIPARPEF